MPGQQSEVTSTLAPSDSASAAGSKKSKPGKAERAARRAATGSVAGQPASSTKAMTFATGVSAPVPTPGKFPVVFQTGAGEPSRDRSFVIDPTVLASTADAFPERFTLNAKYAEFLSYSEYDDDDFRQQLLSATILRLAQQVVHSHTNMGLPQGDFSPVGSTDIRVPGSIAAFISQYGEYSVPSLGTRYLFSDYASTVKSLVWTAEQLVSGGKDKDCDVIARSWLPMNKRDGHTKQIIAAHLNRFLVNAEVQYTETVLEKAVLSGTPPDNWDKLKSLWGDDEDTMNRFDFLFKAYEDAPHFVVAFTEDRPARVLRELGLSWVKPSAGHVDWSYNAKEAFTRLADEWARKSVTYGQFFDLSSSQSNRQAATGSQSQMAVVSENDSVTVVKTNVALSAPEFSLVACFPATGLYSGGITRNVVVTTPLSVRQRATEFVQLDWR